MTNTITTTSLDEGGWLGCLAICLACGRAFLALLGRQNPATFWATTLGLLLAWVVFFVLFSTVEVLGGLLLATIIIFGFGLALVTGAGQGNNGTHVNCAVGVRGDVGSKSRPPHRRAGRRKQRGNSRFPPRGKRQPAPTTRSRPFPSEILSRCYSTYGEPDSRGAFASSRCQAIRTEVDGGGGLGCRRRRGRREGGGERC